MVFVYSNEFPKEISAFIGLSGGRFTLLLIIKSSGRKYLKEA
jgi:hypothetical protein